MPNGLDNVRNLSVAVVKKSTDCRPCTVPDHTEAGMKGVIAIE